MKKWLSGILFSVVMMSAQAGPVLFDFSGSSVSTTGCSICLGSYTGYSGSAMLDDGESQSFKFGTASLIGLGKGKLSFELDMVSPTTDSQSVSSKFKVFSVFILSKGTWKGGDVDFLYNTGVVEGLARLSLDPIDTGVQFGPSFTFTGSITNLGSNPVSVQEPGTVALLAFGLIALGVQKRRAK